MHYRSIVPLSGGGGAKTVADRLPAVTPSDGLIGLPEKLVDDTQEHAAMNGRAITARRVDLKNHLLIVSQVIKLSRASLVIEQLYRCCCTRHIHPYLSFRQCNPGGFIFLAFNGTGTANIQA